MESTNQPQLLGQKEKNSDLTKLRMSMVNNFILSTKKQNIFNPVVDLIELFELTNKTKDGQSND
jgi:hypothetical protein